LAHGTPLTPLFYKYSIVMARNTLVLPLLLACVTAKPSNVRRQKKMMSFEIPASGHLSPSKQTLANDSMSCESDQLMIDPIDGRMKAIVQKAVESMEHRCNAGRSNLPRDQEQLVKQLKHVGWDDVHVLDSPPHVSSVTRWRRNISLAIYGPWTLVKNKIHWYNLISMIAPAMIRFVLEPLQNAKRGDTNIFVTSGLQFELLTDIFSKRIMFDASVPYSVCGDGSGTKLTVPSINKDLAASSTLIMVPLVYPLGHNHHDGAACAPLLLQSMRGWFVRTVSPKLPTQVTFVDRGWNSTKYSKERDGNLLPNMPELDMHISPWAARHGYTYKRVVLESLPFKEQVETIRKTRILVGLEGAGLVNMVFLEHPRQSAVIELNYADGKITSQHEFPLLAERTGVHLWMHIFRCKCYDVLVPCNPARLLDTMGKAQQRLGGSVEHKDRLANGHYDRI